MKRDSDIRVDVDALTEVIAAMFTAGGLDPRASNTVAQALVNADREGQQSHGVMLMDLYIGRIRAGSVSLETEAEIVRDDGTSLVLDARNALGHLTGDRAMALAIARAKTLGVGITAVRNGFHFGTARRFALAAAEQDCVGIAMCNTRPLMPAPGGAEAVVGNNPIAIALPSDDEYPLVLDMAMSEAAMGKIRIAAAVGKPIPQSWATSADGSPTTDASEAIKGMLLPTGGPKGFGLAFMIDLLCGLLSGGGIGDKVTPLYGDWSRAYNCSHLFVAIDVSRFCDPAVFKAAAFAAATRVRQSAKAPGRDRLYVPGEIEAARSKASAENVRLSRATVEGLIRLADDLGVPAGVLRAALDDATEGQRHAEA